jgi:hypothetical protein
MLLGEMPTLEAGWFSIAFPGFPMLSVPGFLLLLKTLKHLEIKRVRVSLP